VKDPARRIQSVVDIRTELEELKREMDSGDLFAEAAGAGARVGSEQAWWTAGGPLSFSSSEAPQAGC
jgi:hypothetical protein